MPIWENNTTSRNRPSIRTTFSAKCKPSKLLTWQKHPVYLACLQPRQPCTKIPKTLNPNAPYHIPLPHPTTSQNQSGLIHWTSVDPLVEDIEVKGTIPSHNIANMIYYSSVCFTSLFSRFYQKKIKKFWKNQSIDINRHQTTNDQSTLTNRPMICEE